MQKRWLSFLAAAAAGLSGCAVGPDYQPPDISVPTSFGAASKISSDAGPPTALTASSQWWQALNDRQLNALVERAVASNPDVEAALTRVQRARTEEIVVLNAALPEAGVSGGVGAGTGLDLTRGRVANSLRAGSSTNGLSALSGTVGAWSSTFSGNTGTCGRRAWPVLHPIYHCGGNATGRHFFHEPRLD